MESIFISPTAGKAEDAVSTATLDTSPADLSLPETPTKKRSIADGDSSPPSPSHHSSKKSRGMGVFPVELWDFLHHAIFHEGYHSKLQDDRFHRLEQWKDFPAIMLIDPDLVPEFHLELYRYTLTYQFTSEYTEFLESFISDCHGFQKNRNTGQPMDVGVTFTRGLDVMKDYDPKQHNSEIPDGLENWLADVQLVELRWICATYDEFITVPKDKDLPKERVFPQEERWSDAWFEADAKKRSPDQGLPTKWVRMGSCTYNFSRAWESLPNCLTSMKSLVIDLVGFHCNTVAKGRSLTRGLRKLHAKFPNLENLTVRGMSYRFRGLNYRDFAHLVKDGGHICFEHSHWNLDRHGRHLYRLSDHFHRYDYPLHSSYPVRVRKENVLDYYNATMEIWNDLEVVDHTENQEDMRYGTSYKTEADHTDPGVFDDDEVYGPTHDGHQDDIEDLMSDIEDTHTHIHGSGGWGGNCDYGGDYEVDWDPSGYASEDVESEGDDEGDESDDDDDAENSDY